jgi:protoporphyrinogen oxidase
VRCERLGEYWFDLVIHLLYFQDPSTEARIRALLGDVLAPCPPQAWVETDAGTCRFPIQMHLHGLEPSVRVQILTEMAQLEFGPRATEPRTIEEIFVHAFGPTLCSLFLLPYNRKMWKRPLSSITHRGLSWNIERPDFAVVLRGALEAECENVAYNSRGNYPRPAAGAPVRGMEVVSHALAERVGDLRLECSVTAIDAAERIVHYSQRVNGSMVQQSVSYEHRLLSTIPLPKLVELCCDAPRSLCDRMAKLRRNRVISVFIAIEGARPRALGHWRYFADESLCFTRLIFMHEFDPAMAPASGWGLLVEVSQRAEDPFGDSAELCQRAIADARRVGVIRATDRVLESRAEIVDPAYVVLADGDQEVIDGAMEFFGRFGIDCRGRYGMWKYSGMSQCLREGFEWAEAVLAGTRPEGAS